MKQNVSAMSSFFFFKHKIFFNLFFTIGECPAVDTDTGIFNWGLF